MTNVLTLVEQRVLGTVVRKRGLFRREVEETVEVYLDFVIDGKSLRAWVQGWEGEDASLDQVSRLALSQPKPGLEQIDRLLGRRAHQYWDRGWLLFCGCWDEGCSAVTADVRRLDNQVSWSRLGWSNSYDPETEFLESAVDFVFDEADYDRVLLEARARLVG